LFACLAATSTSASAQEDVERQEARELANRAYERFTSGDYAESIGLFQQAEMLSHSPVILSFIAQAYDKLGNLIEARTYYARIVNERLAPDAPEDFRKAQRTARREVPLLQRRIPRLQLRISGVAADEFDVSLDGTKLTLADLGGPIEVNPGTRRLVLRIEGTPPIERSVTATERQVTDVDLVLATREVGAEPPPPPPPDYGWVGPVIGYGVGLAGLTLGLTAGGLYLSRSSNLRDRCPANRCSPELIGEKETLDSLGIASVVGFGFAAAGVAVGTTLLLVGEGESDGDVVVMLHPSGVAVSGRF
jgi:hypothetical protein